MISASDPKRESAAGWHHLRRPPTAPRASEPDSRKPETQSRSHQDRPGRVAGRQLVVRGALQTRSTPSGLPARNDAFQRKPPTSRRLYFVSSPCPGDHIVRQGLLLKLPSGQRDRGTNARICRYRIPIQLHLVSLEPRLCKDLAARRHAAPRSSRSTST